MTLGVAALIVGFGFVLGMAAGLSLAMLILSMGWRQSEPDADAS